MEAFGTDFGMHSPRFLSRFTDMARQAERYRAGRVLLAGDAAHVHSPVGGQSLNLGMQDAVNLGWKLALVAKGIAPDALLDSYQAERHPVAARVLSDTLAQVALLRTDDRTEALRAVVAGMLRIDVVRRRFGARMSGLDIRYDFGDGHPLLGCRMPDVDLWPRRQERCVRMPCCMRRGPCCSTSAGREASTRGHGPAGCVWSRPAAMARGSFRLTAWCRRRPPCWCGRTGTWPGSAKGATRACGRRWRPGSVRPAHERQRPPGPGPG